MKGGSWGMVITKPKPRLPWRGPANRFGTGCAEMCSMAGSVDRDDDDGGRRNGRRSSTNCAEVLLAQIGRAPPRGSGGPAIPTLMSAARPQGARPEKKTDIWICHPSSRSNGHELSKRTSAARPLPTSHWSSSRRAVVWR